MMNFQTVALDCCFSFKPKLCKKNVLKFNSGILRNFRLFLQKCICKEICCTLSIPMTALKIPTMFCSLSQNTLISVC